MSISRLIQRGNCLGKLENITVSHSKLNIRKNIIDNAVHIFHVDTNFDFLWEFFFVVKQKEPC